MGLATVPMRLEAFLVGLATVLMRLETFLVGPIQPCLIAEGTRLGQGGHPPTVGIIRLSAITRDLPGMAVLRRLRP